MNKSINNPFSPYFEFYTPKEAPFMHQQWAEWSKTKPLSGLRVLHHAPLVRNTLLKIACLIASGADVTVTNPSSFVMADPETALFLEKNGIRYEADLSRLLGEKWDIYFDCGAQLYQACGTPRIGAIELTGSGDTYYREQTLNFPVLSIDRTWTKQLETVFGTAESANQAIAQLKHINLSEKSWLIFGFGKIGTGLAYYCAQNNIPVTVVEPNQERQLTAQSLGLKVIPPDDKESVQAALKVSDIVVTATGVKSLLSMYPREWFNHKILANMGIYDEFGPAFSESDVLNNKKPVNFILEDPTPMKYIDPEFYIHNVAALFLLNQSYTPGVHNAPPELDKKIIESWCTHHDVSMKILQQWFMSF